MKINFNPDGYTVWAEEIPVILTDAPYERLKSDPEYAIEFVDLLYNELAKTQKENKRLREALEFYADECNNHYFADYPDSYLTESKVMEDDGNKARQALKGGVHHDTHKS